MDLASTKQNESGWHAAWRALEEWLTHPGKADALAESLWSGLDAAERRRAQHLFYGVVRNYRLLEEAVIPHCQRPPALKVLALLLLGTFEATQPGAEVPKVVHFWVEKAGTVAAPLKGFANAVLRKSVAVANRIASDVSPEAWGVRFSHPDWLVARWRRNFGDEGTLALLEWDQQPARMYLRFADVARTAEWPQAATPWPGFVHADGLPPATVREAMRLGDAYAMDPASRLPGEFSGVKPGDKVLDLCAAPGGKSRMVAERLKGDAESLLVSVDLPGSRLDLLRQNLGKVTDVRTMIVAADVTLLTPSSLVAQGAPERYDVVLLDAPCSNTGVLRRRFDAKWRLEAADVVRMVSVQRQMLQRAVSLVRPGGRLVYSTCSLEPEENVNTVNWLMNQFRGRLVVLEQKVSKPWVDGHDGGAVFVIGCA